MENPLIDVIMETVRVLDAEQVPYAVTGSVASSIHGEPYVSADVDIVVRMTPDQATRLARSLPPRFYRSEQALVEAAARSSIAHLIDTETGLKVDLSVLSPGSFHDGILRRAEPVTADEVSFRCVSPEDTILMKLVWRRDSRSQKQWENALGVVRVQAARLDWKYLFEQAESLGVADDLAALRDAGGV